MSAGLIVAAFFVAIFAILVLISLHELGHFLIAKMCGAYVYEFSIGYGPRIFTHKGKETWFSIRLFPLGGFCSIASDRADPPKGREEDEELIPDNRKMDYIARWKKALFILAGPVMNFAIAIIMISLIFMITLQKPSDMGFNGNQFNKDQIAYKLIDKNLHGKNKELFEKDTQNISITGWEVIQVSNEFAKQNINELSSQQLFDNSKDTEKNVKFIYSNLIYGDWSKDLTKSHEEDSYYRYSKDAGFKDLWLLNPENPNQIKAPTYSKIVYNFLDNFDNDKFVETDGLHTEIRFSYRMMNPNLYSGEYQLNDGKLTDNVTSFSDKDEFKLDKKNTTKVGVMAPTRYFKNTTKAYGYSWHEMGVQSLALLKAFAMLFTGHIGQLAGPVGTANQTAQMITKPESLFLYIAGLSANLFVLNLIPIPPLDGYRFIENGVEACMIREVSQRTKLWLYAIGVGIFVIIFVAVTIKDFVVG